MSLCGFDREFGVRDVAKVMAFGCSRRNECTSRKGEKHCVNCSAPIAVGDRYVSAEFLDEDSGNICVRFWCLACDVARLVE